MALGAVEGTMLALSFAVLPLITDPAALQAVPEGPRPLLAQPSDLPAAYSETEPEAEPAATAEVPAAEPVALPDMQLPKKEWMVVISPGFDYLSAFGAYTALGGGARVGAHAVLWGGAEGHFFVGGGPVLQYTFFKDREFDDTLHLFTVNGDFIIGGGGAGKWGVYGHMVLGLGYFAVRDAQTDTSIGGFGARAGAGVGGFGKITDRFSLGGLVDVGYAGAGIWINPMITANIHFGRGGQDL